MRGGTLALQYHQAQDVAELLERVESNTRRYQSMFAEAADDLMHDPLLFPPAQLISAPRDVFDVMRAQVLGLSDRQSPNSLGKRGCLFLETSLFGKICHKLAALQQSLSMKPSFANVGGIRTREKHIGLCREKQGRDKESKKENLM